MAHFLKSSETITVLNSKTITMYGGGPPPNNEKLDFLAEKPDIVDLTFKNAATGPYYEWEVRGKLPGVTKIRAVIPGTQTDWSNPMILTINGRINIEISSNGEGTLECVGLGKFKILGDPTKKYPTDITVDPLADAGVKERVHQSREFNVAMPFAVRIWGQLGIYIHEFPDNLQDNGGPSAGCIHVGKGNAEKVYNYVVTRTRIIIKQH
jgi:hypothetical protein